jgi:hypothetical protein
VHPAVISKVSRFIASEPKQDLTEYVVDLDRLEGRTTLGLSEYDHIVPGQTFRDYRQSMTANAVLGRSEGTSDHAGMRVYHGFCGDYHHSN